MKFISNFIFILSLYLIKCLNKLRHFTVKDILDMEKNKENLGFIYINSRNMSHNFFMDEVSNYLKLNPLEQYNFGYLDIENDQKMLNYFKIKDIKDSGIIIYCFEDDIYYVEEKINHLDEVKNILEQVKNNTLNWSSNNIVERVFYLITGKRYGKKAHIYFAYGICLISILLFIFVNYLTKKDEKELNEKKKK